MLELRDLTKHFGGVKAVENLNMSVSEGEIFGLIGPNGSGKSTTINLICGVYPETSGTVTFCGLMMNGMPPHQRLRAGVARTFQNIRLFPNLSVWQNLLVAQNSPDDVVTQRFLPRWFGTTHQTRENIAELLDLAGLSEKSDELASNLAFGEQTATRVCPSNVDSSKIIAARRASGWYEPERDRRLKLYASPRCATLE